MFYRATVLSAWRVVDGGNEMAVAVDYPAAWQDITMQPDANIPTDPNLFVAEGLLLGSQLDALEADAQYAVLESEEVSIVEAVQALGADVIDRWFTLGFGTPAEQAEWEASL